MKKMTTGVETPNRGLVVMDASQFEMLPTCLTVKEAAQYLKHCAKWVRQKLHALQIPVLVVGSKILIPQAHLALFFQTGQPKRAKRTKMGV